MIKIRHKDVDNEYEIIGIIGDGGYGIVLHVCERLTNINYAMKIIKCDNIEILKKSKLESTQIQQSIISPFICSFYGCFSKQIESLYYVYIIMELCYEGTLNDLLKLKKEKKEYINENQIIKWMYDISNGLEIIHLNDLIHRDIKPDNLLLFNNNKNIKITDFGITSLDNITLTTGKGTIAYMPQEQMNTINMINLLIYLHLVQQYMKLLH